MNSWSEHENSCRVPIIPTDILERFSVHGLKDTRFASCARLLQAIWRERRGLEIGTFITSDGEVRQLGSRISEPKARAGFAFLAPDIAKTVRREVAYREIGALIEEKRVWGNLLSSQGLAFNLFARACNDREYATRLFSILLPGVIDEVHSVVFEHSPGRGNLSFLGDNTAFDLFVRGSCAGCPTFASVELKYADPMGPRSRTNPRYLELARAHGLHADPTHPRLFKEPLAQLTAEHLLSATVLEALGNDARGCFAIIAPSGNREVWSAIEAYRLSLAPEPLRVPFISTTLEAVIRAIGEAGDVALADDLCERYTDFGPVHALIDEWEPFANG